VVGLVIVSQIVHPSRPARAAGSISFVGYTLVNQGDVGLDLGQGGQIGASVVIEGSSPSYSAIIGARPDAWGTTMRLDLSGLPSSPFRLVLYLAADGVDTDGCFTVVTPGGFLQQYGFVNGDAMERGTATAYALN
jgi:hypothetical protein